MKYYKLNEINRVQVGRNQAIIHNTVIMLPDSEGIIDHLKNIAQACCYRSTAYMWSHRKLYWHNNVAYNNPKFWGSAEYQIISIELETDFIIDDKHYQGILSEDEWEQLLNTNDED